MLVKASNLQVLFNSQFCCLDDFAHLMVREVFCFNRFMLPLLPQDAAQPWTVSQLSKHLKQSIETTYGKIALRAELSGVKQHSSGHWYFSLKDEDAVLDGVCWRGTPLSILLVDGLEVVAKGRLTTYPGRSKYQMVVESVESYGEGALLKVLLERKNTLKAEGLFDHKKPLPSFPQCIGIVTSPTGAVIQDILHRLQDRYPCCHVMVWPVLVQGEGASEQITQAILGFNGMVFSQRPDLLIIARGGGSLEDLWAFNEENVVRATAGSLIPTISAIGHETDTTLIDFAADLRAPTPTAAAEIAVPVLKDLLQYLKVAQGRLDALTQRWLQTQSLIIQTYSRGLGDPKRLLEPMWMRLDDWSERLKTGISVLLNRQMHHLHLYGVQLRKPSEMIEYKRLILGSLVQRIQSIMATYVTSFNHQLSAFEHSLEQLSPTRVLERGFCWVSTPEGVIDSVARFHRRSPQTLSLAFSDGKIDIHIKKR